MLLKVIGEYLTYQFMPVRELHRPAKMPAEVRRATSPAAAAAHQARLAVLFPKFGRWALPGYELEDAVLLPLQCCVFKW
ncbi:hypothetical protein O9993_03235 [Vibrio lentus]|nr:hypothetical protein [Vibrio lentus]